VLSIKDHKILGEVERKKRRRRKPGRIRQRSKRPIRGVAAREKNVLRSAAPAISSDQTMTARADEIKGNFNGAIFTEQEGARNLRGGEGKKEKVPGDQ